ncbi:DUF2975 domain-containing protein [Erysipelothrix urinaevulpis]|uniref:DUF2975 domain-containing protein n=1 Tax=Erysipelothrix urinaevulpis TaxID=2683717 RepID=UPI001357BDC9|nr:DUF2975 domain-containing protein [Erysipelothrix urinaevulpis]
MKRVDSSRVLRVLILSFFILGVYIMIGFAPKIWIIYFQHQVSKIIFSLFMMLSSIPYFLSLVILWRLVDSYAKNQFINANNVKAIKTISYFSLIEFILYLFISILLIITNITVGIEGKMFILVILLVSSLLTITLSVFSTILYEAVHLKEESELTI